ncbi:MAG: UvrD-helicase domain-containing protein [Burkholderiaceae bacterium]|nr:UvrD-helicase domain-containing protein [Burkholderiaceae bacterium]
MTPKMLIIDEAALAILDGAMIEDAWFSEFSVPNGSTALRRVMISDHVYIFSAKADTDSNYLVVNTAVFENSTDRVALFARIIRVGLRQFDRNISLPVPWQPFHEGSLLSIYAYPMRKPGGPRLHFNQAPDESSNIYAYAITSTTQPFGEVREDAIAYRAAMETLVDALLKETLQEAAVGNYGILLSLPTEIDFAAVGTLAEWYEFKLNPEQRSFVDKSHDAPIRLRGAAGTGKTQAMVVKCLHDLYKDHDAGGNKTFAFITHSSALAHDVLRRLLHALDASERWAQLKTPSGRPKLWIGTLYELAQDKLGYEKKGLRPLSIDGLDGRELQKMLIVDAISTIRENPRTALGLVKECPNLAHFFTKGAISEPQVEDILNEFACVLDAENIRKGTDAAERYVGGKREAWQMSLPKPEDRRLMLELHHEYREALRREQFLSMDQMIADFGRYLTTHEWDQLRERDGFDLLFVDEYHYFNRLEAMTLQNLFTPRASNDGRWPLFMAYDLKQSTSDAGLGGGIERFRNPGVGKSLQVDLDRVYRSTPEITSFLADLDAAFPAIDLEGEYTNYTGKSEQESGDVPLLLEFETNIKLIDNVVELALISARKLAGGGRQVAILCSNEALFDQYRKAGRIRDKVVTVVSRDDMRELRYAKSRCILSMPDYVAGLQFDAVYLINFDRVDLSDDFVSQGARRRYISRAYLGASRACKSLVLACSNERGGPSEILNATLHNGSLKRG